MMPKETQLAKNKLIIKWKQDGKSQPVYRLPIEYCRYRAENGRIKLKL